MIYVRQPTDEEKLELRRMMRQEVGRVSQRAHMVLLSATRHSVPEIAELFEVCRASVRFWLRHFDTEGPRGLYDDPRSVAPGRWTSELKRRLSASSIPIRSKQATWLPSGRWRCWYWPWSRS